LCKNKRVRNEPFVLDVLVDAGGNENSDDGVVPAGNEHERETQADAEHRQNPACDAVQHNNKFYTRSYKNNQSDRLRVAEKKVKGKGF